MLCEEASREELCDRLAFAVDKPLSQGQLNPVNRRGTASPAYPYLCFIATFFVESKYFPYYINH